VISAQTLAAQRKLSKLRGWLTWHPEAAMIA
jgi:hypothetical protein